MNRVIFNSSCNTCIQIQRILKKLDFFSFFTWIKSEDINNRQSYSFVKHYVDNSIVIITKNNNLLTHYKACRYILIRIPVFAPFIFLLYIPFFSNFIGNKIYGYIASSRKCIIV